MLGARHTLEGTAMEKEILPPYGFEVDVEGRYYAMCVEVSALKLVHEGLSRGRYL